MALPGDPSVIFLPTLAAVRQPDQERIQELALQ
jgi:hypothetical protein